MFGLTKFQGYIFGNLGYPTVRFVVVWWLIFVLESLSN